ncbi:MAG: nucleotide exchange factor GrpE [Nitrospinae bacterium]|nr:nucleotide exchange factor GrpE [Nitrospinota bacterium]
MNEDVNEYNSSDKKTEAERAGASEAAPKPGAGAEAEPSARSELEKLRHEILLQRADFINVRRRLEKQMHDEVRYASTALVRELVQVVDHLELALNHATEDDPMRKGVALVLDGMLKTLAKFEVRKTGAKGEKFDPSRHEAVSVVSDPALADDVVAEVVRPGYTFHDRLIRAAGVLVNRLPHDDPGKK